MRCQRCRGLCVREYLREGGAAIPVAKCINCGEIVDPRILRNRAGQIRQGPPEQGMPSITRQILGLTRTLRSSQRVIEIEGRQKERKALWLKCLAS